MKTILRKKPVALVAICVFILYLVVLFTLICRNQNSHEIAITPYRGNTQFVSENIQTVSSTANGDIVITTTDGEKFIFTN